jgi:hypothetical protein
MCTLEINAEYNLRTTEWFLVLDFNLSQITECSGLVLQSCYECTSVNVISVTAAKYSEPMTSTEAELELVVIEGKETKKEKKEKKTKRKESKKNLSTKDEILDVNHDEKYQIAKALAHLQRGKV